MKQMNEIFRFNTLAELKLFYDVHQERLIAKDPLINNFLFNTNWSMIKSSEEEPFIAVYEEDSTVQTAFFSCSKVMMKKLTVTEKGTRQYEETFELPVYRRAYTYQGLYDVSADFFYRIIDDLFKTPVDVVLIYVYKQDYDKLTTYLNQNKKYNYNAKCYSHAFEGEIGHNRFDSMQLIFPDTFEKIFEPFQKNRQHRYHLRQLNRIQRRAETQYDIQYKTISPLSEITVLEAETMFEDVEFIYSNSWQSELNNDYQVDKLSFLFQQKKLMLLVAYADDIPASYFYGYVDEGKIHESWMAYNTVFSRFSFGLITLVQFLKLCVECSIHSLEFGGTTHQYKTDIVNKKEPIYEILIFNPESTISKELKVIKRCYPKALI
ncbi:hypothetical protein D3C74_264000 [compost metagenome]